jgi:hypothetical protein
MKMIRKIHWHVITCNEPLAKRAAPIKRNGPYESTASIEIYANCLAAKGQIHFIGPCSFNFWGFISSSSSAMFIH